MCSSRANTKKEKRKTDGFSYFFKTIFSMSERQLEAVLGLVQIMSCTSTLRRRASFKHSFWLFGLNLTAGESAGPLTAYTTANLVSDAATQHKSSCQTVAAIGQSCDLSASIIFQFEVLHGIHQTRTTYCWSYEIIFSIILWIKVRYVKDVDGCLQIIKPWVQSGDSV